MKKAITIILVLLSLGAFSQSEDKSPNYSGGMFLQTSYLNINHNYANISGTAIGLGGMLNFYISDHFNIGTTGGSVTVNYGDKNSYYSLGYGGLSLRYYTLQNRWRFSAGVLIGGGAITVLNVTQEINNNIFADYSKESCMVFSPLLMVEYYLTDKISCLMQFDYLMGSKVSKDYTLTYPKMQIGILFNR